MYVDGGHVKDKDREKKSFEALLAAVFKADSYKKAANSNTAIPKHIAASAINDGGKKRRHEQKYRNNCVLRWSRKLLEYC